MTEQQHPIKLLPGLVQLWRRNWNHAHGEFGDYLATQSARWGADQELQACCEYMQHEDFHGFARELRAARRPKPPSLAEEALAALEEEDDSMPLMSLKRGERFALIRTALERLQELENHQ